MAFKNKNILLLLLSSSSCAILICTTAHFLSQRKPLFKNPTAG
jgi:hypothetical protein